MRILIAEDDMISRRVLERTLTKWGYEVVSTRDGAEAWEILKSEDTPSIAILDWEMPKIDGIELIRKIRANQNSNYIYTLILTAKSHKQDIITGIESGADDYLSKPFNQNELRARLHTGERIINLEQNLAHKNKELGSANLNDGTGKVGKKQLVTRHTIAEDRKLKLKILLAEDNIVNQKVARKMLQKFGYQVDCVANGREAVEAIKSIPYDVVLMDCQMPEMDGYEATGEIRRVEPKDQHIPIIALTANAMQGDREKCLDAGMDDYISKPVNAIKLKEAIDKWGQKITVVEEEHQKELSQ